MVDSDIAPLRKVVVHRPDEGVEWVTPFNKEELLYDDIVFLPEMVEEHTYLQDVLAFFTGRENVLELADMLTDVLRNEKLRKQLQEEICELENIPASLAQKLELLSPLSLAKALINGYKENGGLLINPVPNLLFTRDLGAVVNNFVISCYAAKPPRKRENVLTWYITHHHPAFTALGYEHLEIATPDLKEKELLMGPMTLEGGDIIHLNSNHLLIACSERTNLAALQKMKLLLERRGVVRRFTVVHIPKEEYCMHIDTIFSQVNFHDYVLYEEVLENPDLVKIESHDLQSGKVTSFATMKALILAEDPNARFVACGNGEYPYNEREQWSSACNFVAVKPGVAITYRRNVKTVEGFARLGYKVVRAEDFLEAVNNSGLSPEEVSNTIITIPAGELSRGGGGPHCLTFPIERTSEGAA